MIAFLCFFLGAALAALGAWRMPPCWEPPDMRTASAAVMIVVGGAVASLGVFLAVFGR